MANEGNVILEVKNLKKYFLKIKFLFVIMY